MHLQYFARLRVVCLRPDLEAQFSPVDRGVPLDQHFARGKLSAGEGKLGSTELSDLVLDDELVVLVDDDQLPERYHLRNEIVSLLAREEVADRILLRSIVALSDEGLVDSAAELSGLTPTTIGRDQVVLNGRSVLGVERVVDVRPCLEHGRSIARKDLIRVTRRVRQ